MEIFLPGHPGDHQTASGGLTPFRLTRKNYKVARGVGGTSWLRRLLGCGWLGSKKNIAPYFF